jgi:nitric oxide reductase large subunit
MKAKDISILLWIVTILASGYAGLQLLLGMLTASSAPQQGAVGAMSVAIAVIPYCVARAFD